MKSFESAPKENRPNYTNEHSVAAEIGIDEILVRARVLGVETRSLFNDSVEVLRLAQETVPERYNLVRDKLAQEGLRFDDLPDDTIADRLLGVDRVFAYEGRVYAVDVTSGKHTVIKNKVKKLEAMQSTLQKLGVDQALVVRLKQKITDDLILDFFTKLDTRADSFCRVISYPDTKRKTTGINPT